MPPLDRYNASTQPPLLDLPALKHRIVLEQRDTFCLCQDRATQFYYVYETQAATVVLRTEQWSEVYRGWLRLLQGHECSPHPLQEELLSASELHRWIDHRQEDAEFGQLLYSRDRRFPSVLQYSVQISTDHALCWAPTTPHSIALGGFILEKIGPRRHRPAKWVEQQPQSIIADILHRSIETFHQRWNYNLYQFNSEHWARLAVTGHCCSLQTEDLQHYWIHTQTGADPRLCEPKPDIWDINFDIQTLLQLAIAP
jgi:hypothetical protein